jgi:hypothetical protein
MNYLEQWRDLGGKVLVGMRDDGGVELRSIYFADGTIQYTAATGSGGSSAWASITGKPTTLAGYGVTAVAWSLITGKPTTLAGYGITDALPSSTVLPAADAGSTHHFLTTYNATTGLFTDAQPTFTDLSSHPTTLAGYGITDGTPPGGAVGTVQGNNAGVFNGLPGSIIDFTEGTLVIATPGTGTPLTLIGDSSQSDIIDLQNNINISVFSVDDIGAIRCGPVNTNQIVLSGDLSIGTTLTDGSGYDGTSGQVLSSTGTATLWITPTIAAWSALTGTLANGTVIPYSDSGISRLGAASLAIGNGTNGDFTGSLKLTTLTCVGTIVQSTSQVHSWNADAGISRLGAASLAIGNGTAGDFTGSLKATIFNAVTGFQIGGAAATAGHVLRANGTNYVDAQLGYSDLSGTPAASLPLAGGTLTGGLGFTDNTLDIGAVSTIRPRTIYAGTSIISPLHNFVGNDAGISRLGAASLAIGNGTAADASGKLTLATQAAKTNSTLVATTAYADAAVTVATANVSVANQGIFWGPGYTQPSTATQLLSNVTGGQAANSVIAYQFVLPFTISIKHVSAGITGIGGGFVGFALFSADGQTRLVDSGPIGATGTPKTVTLGGTVALTPGVYWFAQTSSTITDSVILWASNSGAQFFPNQLNLCSVAPKVILAGNVSVAGQMPTSLGTMTSGLSGATTSPYPACVGFEP